MQSVAAAAIQDEIRRKTLGSNGIKTELTIGNMGNVALLDVADFGFESRWRPVRNHDRPMIPQTFAVQR